MTKQKWSLALWALLLMLVGVVALAYNFGVFDAYKLMTAYVIAAVLVVMGLGFLLAIIFQKEQWFYVIPGFSLLSLGGVVYLSTLENVKPEWMGALFLGGIALGFLVIFLRKRQERWWALLQAETILIIALVGLGMGVPDNAVALVGAILVGGFALSFFFVWLLSGNRGRFAWALILAAVLAIFAAVIFTAGQNRIWQLAWPVLVLILGLFLLIRAFSGGKKTPAVPIEQIKEPGGALPADEAEPAKILPPSGQQPQHSPQPLQPAPWEPPEPLSGDLESEVMEPEPEGVDESD
ncbi:MAG: hypothetical protein DSY55_05300 [Clostridia bacterium]|nr:MAG: hypothetical protein DSY55_05300 [Clostridia bacterium]